MAYDAQSSKQQPAPDTSSTGKKGRGAKTVRHYEQLIAARYAGFLDWEAWMVKQWSPDTPTNPHISNSNAFYGMLLEIEYGSFLKAMREAQRAHPGYVWGYMEG